MAKGESKIPNVVRATKAGQRRQNKEGGNAPKKNKSEKISTGSFYLMMGTALFFDLIAAILGLLDYLLPPVGTILSVITSAIGYATMWLWFAMKGVSLLNNSKKALNFFGGMVIEAIPYINILPGISFSTFRTITITRLEDKKSNIPV